MQRIPMTRSLALDARWLMSTILFATVFAAAATLSFITFPSHANACCVYNGLDGPVYDCGPGCDNLYYQGTYYFQSSYEDYYYSQGTYYDYTQGSYYPYAQASYYPYAQASYYPYSQGAYGGGYSYGQGAYQYTYGQGSYYSYGQGSYSSQCSDGSDNDGDGYTDYAGGDPSCTSGSDNTETPASPVANLSCTSPGPCTISPGGTATLTYSSSNATSCVFADTGVVGTSGTRNVSPAATSIYDLYCRTVSEDSTHKQATVTVNSGSVYLTATPGRISSGGSSTLYWSASGLPNGTTCSMTKNGSAFTPPLPSNFTPSGGAIATSTTGSVQTNLTAQTIYKITCGTATSQTIVNINGQIQEF